MCVCVCVSSSHDSPPSAPISIYDFTVFVPLSSMWTFSSKLFNQSKNHKDDSSTESAGRHLTSSKWATCHFSNTFRNLAAQTNHLLVWTSATFTLLWLSADCVNKSDDKPDSGSFRFNKPTGRWTLTFYMTVSVIVWSVPTGWFLQTLGQLI